jgi:S-adenosylmethionine:tRNA ribosyltransferase-isomerase
MLVTDLDYEFPSELIALEPSRPSRVAFVKLPHAPQEMSIESLLNRFQSGDLLVINESKVIPARVFANDHSEILFLRHVTALEWQVLFPAREFKVGDVLNLPGDLKLTLKQKGLPQTVSLSFPIDEQYFSTHGEFALPPYIQQARGERHNRANDISWYQAAWAQKSGSVAAPTASLHFLAADLEHLEKKGVRIARVVLHVGAGTFLPIRGESLDSHEMHAEMVHVPEQTVKLIEITKSQGHRVWALGTTVTRALESMANGLLQRSSDGFSGDTKLFIQPAYNFKVVDALLTNFHQPRTTLLALVAAFAGLENVKSTYLWAVKNRFKLFSYGDLSAWIR